MNTSWQWQLSGTIDQTVDAEMYDIDGFDNDASTVTSLHAKGRKVVCYISAGTWEDWRSDAGSFPASVKGSGNGWPGEKWLDIRNIAVLGPIMQARMDMCVQKGFDALEPDNIDGYSNSTGFPLTAQDQITYNTWLADQAHARGLSIGLKNDNDQITQLLPYFDWALNEECYDYSECNPYKAFTTAGKAVFIAEYNLATTKFCDDANANNWNAAKFDLNLTGVRTPCRPPANGTPSPSNTPAVFSPTPTRSPASTPTRTPTPGIPTPTRTPTPSLTQTPTPTQTGPTLTRTPTPTTPLNSTSLSIVLKFHGIGTGGDNVSDTSGGNLNPITPNRTIQLKLYNSINQLVGQPTGTIIYRPTTGDFAGIVNAGTNMLTGAYLIQIKSDKYLTRQLPGIQNIVAGQTNTTSQASLIVGDSNNDDLISILDYNILIDCYSELLPAKNCSDPAKKTSADLTDDGKVDSIDYNLFLRELSVQR